MLGEFLEISIECKTVLQSVQFFERLGFWQVSTLDTWSHHYGVLTDGRVHLGLHGYEFPSPSLTFVARDLANRVPILRDIGIEFEFCKLEIDGFHEAGFFDPDGHMVCLLEARTYTPAETGNDRASVCGFFTDYCLPARNAAESLTYWEKLGMLPGESGNGIATAHATGINLCFDENHRLRNPLLRFEHPDINKLAEELEQRDVEYRKESGNSLRIPSPEIPDLLIQQS